MSQVENRLKEKADCPCDEQCGKFGTPKGSPEKDGLFHVKACTCRRCKARNYKRRASKRERQIGKATGGARNVGSGAFGGLDTIGGVCVAEETAEKRYTRGLFAWWNGAGVVEKTVKVRAQRPSERPAAFIASDETKPLLVVMEYRAFEQLCLLAQQGDI